MIYISHPYGGKEENKANVFRPTRQGMKIWQRANGLR